MRVRKALLLPLLFASVSVWGNAQTPDADIAAVRGLLKHTYDKAGAPLAIDVVVLEGDTAIADWSQADLAGRALLRRKEGRWEIALCAGDALKSSSSLEKLGMSTASASALAQKLLEAERGLSAERLQKISRFDGVVAVDAAGGQTPADLHHRPLQ